MELDVQDVRFGSKADMCSAQADVRFVPLADIVEVRGVTERVFLLAVVPDIGREFPIVSDFFPDDHIL
ncbi:MAG: hypothetical protein WCD83_10385, partial [Pseudolabrys sp.]